MATEVNKPDFSFQWASGGAIVAPSNVKIQTGWTAEVPPFQWENFLQNRQDNAILHLFQKGVSVWSATENYYSTTNGTKSYVQGSNGVIYVGVQNSINQNPVTDVTFTYWKPFVPAGGTLIKTTVINTSGTFTFDTRTTKYRLRGVGGGGGGGGSAATSVGNAAAGSGGTAGSYGEGIYTSPPVSVAVTVGSAGTGGVGTLSGTNGGDSVFGVIMTCPGGFGGVGSAQAAIAARISAANSGTGNAPTGTNIASVPGQAGDNGIVLNSSQAGAGGSNPLGTGGNAPVATGGRDGMGMGGAGSGSNSPSNTAASQQGGNGTKGGWIVEEYV
jgi:hypothetical protein